MTCVAPGSAADSDSTAAAAGAAARRAEAWRSDAGRGEIDGSEPRAVRAGHRQAGPPPVCDAQVRDAQVREAEAWRPPAWESGSWPPGGRQIAAWQPDTDPSTAGLLRQVSVPPQLEALLDRADVRLDGSRPWDLRLHRPGVLAELIRRGSLGFGEAYVRGDWDCSNLDGLFTRLLRAGADRRFAAGSAWSARLAALAGGLVDAQSPRRARRAVRHHYDILPEVYGAMLDPWRQYSCGYWDGATTLEQAQERKLALIAAKLDLAPGQRVLDVGCGWGGLAAWLADGYGVEVVGITLSERQRDWARERWAELPVRFELCDYRKLAELDGGPFDRIVSVGMLEHVGPGHLHRFFQELHRVLRLDGLVLVHTIGYSRRTAATDPWIATHVFPGGRLPAAAELADALAEDWLIEDWHAFGADYDPTLMAWCERFEQAWPRLQPLVAAEGDGAAGAERFRRFWRYYLLCCAGFFRARQGQLWQLVLSPADGLRPAPYRSVRP